MGGGDGRGVRYGGVFQLEMTCGVPGLHITDHQMRLFMTLREDHPVATAKATVSPATGYRILHETIFTSLAHARKELEA